MPTRADRKCASACCFNSGPLPLAQRHVRIIVHRVPAMQYVLENAGPDVEAHAPHHRFIGPKNATEHAVAPGHLKLWERTPIRAGRGTTTVRALLERHPVQIPDVLADPEYDFPQAQELMGFRTVLAVPLLREGVVLAGFDLREVQYEAIPGLHPGRFPDRAPLWWDGPRPCPVAQARAHDGRRP